MNGDLSSTVHPETRQLAAIMFTDIVGFSRQMGADEARMLRLLEVPNRLIQQAVSTQLGGLTKAFECEYRLFFMRLVLQRHEGCPLGVVQRILVEPSLDPWLCLGAEGLFVAEIRSEFQLWAHCVCKEGSFPRPQDV